MPSEAIRQLHDLTMELVNNPFKLAALPDFIGSGDVKRYGETVVTSLFARDGVGVVETYMPSGETFPPHDHTMIETFHLYEGHLHFAMEDGSHRVLRAQQSLSVDPGEAHTVLAVEDSRFVCVTMPRDVGYPG